MGICAGFENKVSSLLNAASSGSVFLAAVSGGADSMALLAALCVLRDNGIIGKDALFCLHVEHALRPAEESLGDAEFVRIFCQKQGIECRVEHIPPGKIASFARRKGTGIEAAARFFRHRALSKEARRLSESSGSNAFILLAHTKDDLLETALMRILRGAGPAGLAAMPAKRGSILRPLLSMSRADVIAYLTEKKIPWREDSTNTDEKFLRNRIRCQLTPLLNGSFPSWQSGLSAMAETQSLVSDFLAGEAKQRIIWEIKSQNVCSSPQNSQTTPITLCNSVVKNPSCLSTKEENFFAQPQIIREEAVFQGINTLCASAPLREKNRIKSIKRSVVRKFCSGKVTAADLGSVRVRLEKGKILLSRAQGEFFECGFSRLIKQPSLDNL